MRRGLLVPEGLVGRPLLAQGVVLGHGVFERRLARCGVGASVHRDDNAPLLEEGERDRGLRPRRVGGPTEVFQHEGPVGLVDGVGHRLEDVLLAAVLVRLGSATGDALDLVEHVVDHRVGGVGLAALRRPADDLGSVVRDGVPLLAAVVECIETTWVQDVSKK